MIERTVTARGVQPEGEGWKLVHAWANPTDGALWLWERVTLPSRVTVLAVNQGGRSQ